MQASSRIQQGEAEGAELDRELAGELGKVVGITKEAKRHLAWAFYFTDTLGAPAEEHWDGRGGTVAQIADTFHVKMGSRGSIRSVDGGVGGRRRPPKRPFSPAVLASKWEVAGRINAASGVFYGQEPDYYAFETPR